MMKLLGRKIDQKGSSDANLPFGSAFGWLQYTFTLTGNISNKNISVQKLGGGLPSRKLTAHHWKSMVGRWKFLLGWHVFGGHIDIGYRIIPSLNVLWILPMAQRWRWKAWLAGSGTWQYGIDEERWMKMNHIIMNTYQVLQTRTNVGQQGKTFPKSTARDLQYLPSCKTYVLPRGCCSGLILTYITTLIPRWNSKNLFRAFLSKKLLLKNQWFFLTPFSSHFWAT